MSKGTILQYNGSGIGTPGGAYAIENLTPENIKLGVSIGGVVGTFNGEQFAPVRVSNEDISFDDQFYSPNYYGTMVIANVERQPKLITIITNGRNTTPAGVVASSVVSFDRSINIMTLASGGYSSGLTPFKKITYDSVTKTLRIPVDHSSSNWGQTRHAYLSTFTYVVVLSF